MIVLILFPHRLLELLLLQIFQFIFSILEMFHSAKDKLIHPTPIFTRSLCHLIFLFSHIPCFISFSHVTSYFHACTMCHRSETVLARVSAFPSSTMSPPPSHPIPPSHPYHHHPGFESSPQSTTIVIINKR